jgi:hypothetical protein
VIEGLWHSTAMGDRYDELLAPYVRLFGAVVMHDRESRDPVVGRRGGMVWLGDNSIELGEPLGDVSPIRGFLQRFGGGMHSVALRIDDVGDARARLDRRGVAVAAEFGDSVFFTRPADTDGLLFEWSAMHTDDDPRFGHQLPVPPEPAEVPLAPARHYGFVTAAVADPISTAEHLASLFGSGVVRRTPGADSGEIAAIVSLVDCLLLLFRLPDRESDWPWGAAPIRPRFHAHGLVVDDLDESLAVLAEDGVAASRHLEHCVLLDTESVPIPTFLCDRLFAEDPRLAGRPG